MQQAYLVHHHDEDNKHRFYQLYVAPGLFDDWSVIKEWGRVGSPGTVRKDWFETENEAITAAIKLCEKKCKKGYRLLFKK